MIPIALDPADTDALYKQIADRVRAAVIAGTLAPGTRLPSSRTLSAQLGVARSAVLGRGRRRCEVDA